MKGNYQFKALTLSSVLHALVFILIIGISGSIVTTNKPIVIDFSIEDSKESGVRSQESALKQVQGRNQKPEVMEQKAEIKNQEQKIVSPIIPENHPVSNIETQAPVPASVEKNPSSENRDRGFIANSNIKTDTMTASGGSSGGSAEEGKGRYLKAHFSYIRDRIQRNLTYPKIAREMGWEGKVTVSFIVSESGYVDNIKIIETSGVNILDKNAVETIKRVSPFPRPPVKAELIMPIVYRLE
jgi:protein TonB